MRSKFTLKKGEVSIIVDKKAADSSIVKIFKHLQNEN